MTENEAGFVEKAKPASASLKGAFQDKLQNQTDTIPTALARFLLMVDWRDNILPMQLIAMVNKMRIK